jgi:hypothetical protein
MNQIIEKLSKQCYVTGPLTRDGWPEYCTFDEQRFADLIIHECINALAAEIVYNEHYTERNKIIGDMMIVVKKHFGDAQ